MKHLINPANRLHRDGTSQSQRRPDALDPKLISIDGRNVEDFLVFARRFSRQVNYRDLDNIDKGWDWESFFQSDPSVVIATIGKTNPQPEQQLAAEALSAWKKPGDIEQLKIFVRHFSKLAEMLLDWRQGVRRDDEFLDQIDRLIRANLTTAVRQVNRVNNGKKQRLVNEASYKKIETLVREKPDSTALSKFTEKSNTEDDDELRNKLQELLGALYRVIVRVIALTTDHFELSLSKRNDVEPHLALFIAFLRLYLLIRDDVNQITQRHLDFFYEQVLFMKKRPAVADHIHLVVELAKQVQDEHLISQGTIVDAGKDATGVQLHYKTTNDLVANKSQIESFRTVYVGKKIHAAETANSGDGKGGEFKETEKPSWPTLGRDDMPEGKLGFAIASRALLLAEGDRVIEVILKSESFVQPDISLPKEAFEVQLSGQKGWIKPEVKKLKIDANNQLLIKLFLDAKADAVTFADASVLEQDFGVNGPILQVTLKSSSGNPFVDDRLKNAIIDKATLNVSVGYKYDDSLTLKPDGNGLTNLIVQNDQFIQDPSKPFQPFGPTPVVGSNFYVGSAEAFEKKLESIELNVGWEGLPAQFEQHYEAYDFPDRLPNKEDFQAKVELRQDGAWEEASSTKLFQASGSEISIDLSGVPTEQAPRQIDELGQWTPATQHGFVRLSLLENKQIEGKSITERIEFSADEKLKLQQKLEIDSLEFEELFVELKLPISDFTFLITLGGSGDNKKELIQGIIGNEPLRRKFLLGLRSLPANLESLRSKAFFHSDFTRIVTRQAMAAAKFDECFPGALYRDRNETKTCAGNSTIPNFEPLVPNEPYTPTIQKIELKYRATVTSNETERTDSISLIHIESFGHSKKPFEVVSADSTIKKPKPKLLPQLDYEGALFLGLKELKARQSVSILFQFAEGTADSGIEKPQVKWSYLADNHWVELKNDFQPIDGTNGLVASGVISFKIPDATTTANTLMPPGFVWLRASVPCAKDARGVSELINAHAQALKATFVDQENDPAHLSAPLPSESVTGLVSDDAAIAGMQQIYDGFGGRPEESGLSFYTRVAEHLRHKGRPITLFDYERIVLENFPKIYKVKCINHTMPDAQKSFEVKGDHIDAPGHVLIAVIPSFQNLKAVDRRRPKVTRNELEEIADFLSTINCPFVDNLPDKKNAEGSSNQPCKTTSTSDNRLHVRNPIYESIRVNFEVRFTADVTAADFQKEKLKLEINRFLSPWAFEDVAEITFGGRIYNSSILNFVETREYVEYVTDFKVEHSSNPEQEKFRGIAEYVEPTTPRSILVPDENHDVQVILGETN